MPSRKKDRGKQRKAAKQRSKPLHLLDDPSPEAASTPLPIVRELKAAGVRIEKGDEGSAVLSHPALQGQPMKDLLCKSITDIGDDIRNFDRGQLTDEGRLALAKNIVHNFAQELREGEYNGTAVIIENLADSHLGATLGGELLKAEIHLSLLHFLGQCDKPMSAVLQIEYDPLGFMSNTLPSFWVDMLRQLAHYGAWDVRLTIATGMGPLAMEMSSGRRELFRNNITWHHSLASFFGLIHDVMSSKDAFLVLACYGGLLPFVAQASCWSQSREDIIAEAGLRRQCQPHEFHDSVCHAAQRVLLLVLRECKDAKAEGKRGTFVSPLDQIACAPLLSNDPECMDSTTMGLVRMMNYPGQKADYIDRIVLFLLLTNDYVDEGVIAALLECDNHSVKNNSTEKNLVMIEAILGRGEDTPNIRQSDSRFAAAVRHGLVEFLIDAFVLHDENYLQRSIGETPHQIAEGLFIAAMHKKTSRALRERKSEILGALDVLQKRPSAPSVICKAINDSISLDTPRCCNCLKELARKRRLFCHCMIECYCSTTCQTESWEAGHEHCCEVLMERYEDARGKGANETELKRMEVATNRLTMWGCKVVHRSRILHAAAKAKGGINSVTVTVDFHIYPPLLQIRDRESSGHSNSLECVFVSPLIYEFSSRVGLESISVKKHIPRRFLTGGSDAKPEMGEKE